MTKEKKKKRRKLSHEILGLIGISALVALVLFLILSGVALAVAEEYCFNNDIPMTEFDWMDLERWIFGGSILLSVAVFSALFLLLLADRLAYIRKITGGIDALRLGRQDHAIAPEGNNELTDLAVAINDMSQAQRQLRQKEQALAAEKEQFVRTMSHDIRTPLTSILAYSEYLASSGDIPADRQKEYLQMMHRKAEQIRDLTDILLDGSKRNMQHFADAKLLMQQLCGEFEEALEDRFQIHTDLSECPEFSGEFDVQELRRIFDNLGSNIQKYADPQTPVCLCVRAGEGQLEIVQRNAVLADAPQAESHGLGLHSIRRIAQHYGGGVEIRQSREEFEISIIFRIL